MLARWCLDVGFQIIFFQITLISETDIVTFGAQNQSFGMPGASTLAPWGTMGRSRGTWGLKKGDLGVQAWISIDFGLISVPHFDSFSGPLDQNWCFFSCLFPGHIFSNSFDFGDGHCLFWWPKQVIWHAWCLHFGTLGDHGTIQGHLGHQERRRWVWDVLQKPSFHRSWNSDDFRINF